MRNCLCICVGLVFLSSTLSLSMDKPYSYYAQWTNSGPLSDSNYFPIAVWLQDPPSVSQYKAMGVNLYIGLWQGPTESQLSGLKNAGMKVLCDQNSVGLTSVNKNVIIGWAQQDEPDDAQPNSSGGYDPCIPTDTIVHIYNSFKSNDATRPVFLNFGQGVANINYIGRGTCSGQWQMYSQYMAGLNIASYDIYPVNSGYSITWVPKGIDSLRSWCQAQKAGRVLD